jgi:hypothetical protein
LRKLSKKEIVDEAKKISDKWLGNYSLKNAKKIVLAVRRNLKAEELRRKELKKGN